MKCHIVKKKREKEHQNGGSMAIDCRNLQCCIDKGQNVNLNSNFYLFVTGIGVSNDGVGFRVYRSAQRNWNLEVRTENFPRSAWIWQLLQKNWRTTFSNFWLSKWQLLQFFGGHTHIFHNHLIRVISFWLSVSLNEICDAPLPMPGCSSGYWTRVLGQM